MVAHRFPTRDIDLENHKQETISKILEENDLSPKGFQIDDMRWLKQEDKPLGAMASLGIWFDTAEAAEWAVMNGLVCDQSHIDNVEVYNIDKKRCHRCQKLGTWRGHAERRNGASTAAEYMTDKTAHLVPLPSASTATGHILLDHRVVLDQSFQDPDDEQNESSHTTTERHEFPSCDGGTHQ